jgi:heme oxygenase
MELITQQDLRNSVKDLHDLAETTQLAQDMISGNLDPMMYKNHCYQLFLITDAIESKFRLPTMLRRKYSLIQDIAELPSGPVKTCPSTLQYVDMLSRQYQPELYQQYKGHIYTHYLGWLYGGQMIAKNLNLPKNHLQFDNVKECIEYVRTKILATIFDYDVEQARKAFEYTIAIYKELYELH